MYVGNLDLLKRVEPGPDRIVLQMVLHGGYNVSVSDTILANIFHESTAFSEARNDFPDVDVQALGEDTADYMQWIRRRQMGSVDSFQRLFVGFSPAQRAL